MTAVLSPTDVFSHDRKHHTHDDSDFSVPSSEWRSKYYEIADMLAETRAELDDFHVTSKELETELEAELQRTEKAQQDLKVKAERAERERDDWKSKFMTLQTTHNTATASLQRELDKLRQEYQSLKIQLRDLEMGNDDLERNERAVSSSLADYEAKYSRVLEEKILLEHELLDKASLEEETQRFKDDLRDANVEISILKDQLEARSRVAPAPVHAPTQRFSTYPPLEHPASEENLLATALPASSSSDLELSDLIPSTDVDPTPVDRTPRATTATRKPPTKSAYPDPSLSTPSPSALGRSPTLPVYRQSPSIRPPSASARPILARTSTHSSQASTSSLTSKNRGVQMVSEMRARVKVLEQKIHTRVPRLRLGSVTTRNNLAASTVSPPVTRPGLAKSSTPSDDRSSIFARRSSESVRRSQDEKPRQNDSSGWVLIMEDSPSPPRKGTQRPRPTSPSSQGSSVPSTSPTFSNLKLGSSSSGLRRPQSRLSSGASASTASSIASSASRPSTPTFIPLPTTHLFAQSTSAGLKRSTGPGSGTLMTSKRSSLSASMNSSPASAKRTRPTTMPPPQRVPTSEATRTKEKEKSLPYLPGGHANVTVRSSKLPSPGTSALGLSRIGRLSSGGSSTTLASGRRSVGETDPAQLGLSKSQLRPRSSSSANTRPT
ncbi:hypothetical protein BDV98DRAFT_600620 [Pterulicium gracile]|uniref:NUDE domain-containing protein n=1 Tax=Pterulicium gracile TaxID=1884261 RepID=A0A5C3QXG6_9AGAR|nr:hypothetical protein BDV98DRAFT_600620 [Pterula gracilis]